MILYSATFALYFIYLKISGKHSLYSVNSTSRNKYRVYNILSL